MDLSRVVARDRLRPRREPYWQRLSRGQFLGFRPSKVGGSGHWIAKFYDPNTRRKIYRALGDFGRLPPNERFTEAKREAERWFEHVAVGGATKSVTVREACERYAQDRPDAARRFRQYVYGDPIAKVPLQKLTKAHVRDWRSRLQQMPTKDGKPRTPATVNRDLVPLKAALNAALEAGQVANALAWESVLRPHKGTDRPRELYLDRQQRRALLEYLPEDVAAFVRGLCLLPLRPGALAALKVGDFDQRHSELIVARDKAGHSRKILLPNEAAALLKEQARSKLPAAPLFARADGKAWNKDAWKYPIREAVKAAGLPAKTTAYTLRHSTITDLVAGGLDLLTVAQISGTSVRMIEKHYGHLQQRHAARALAGLAL